MNEPSKTQPLLSIIIPAYNHSKYIERCLDSILEDPYPHKEIVIIDDGSQDDTYNTATKWADAHSQEIKTTVRTRPNKGTAATVNEAASLAQGDFIAPIASDDYFLPGGFEPRIRYLQNNPHLLLVFGDCITVNGKGETLHTSTLRDFHRTSLTRYKTPRSIAFQIVWRWALPGPVMLMRKEAFALVGGYDEKRVIEDWDFFLKLAAREAVGFLNIPVSAYRWHLTNTCGSPARQAFIRKELALTAFKRLGLFKRAPLLMAILFAKGVYYTLRSVQFYLRTKLSLLKCPTNP